MDTPTKPCQIWLLGIYLFQPQIIHIGQPGSLSTDYFQLRWSRSNPSFWPPFEEKLANPWGFSAGRFVLFSLKSPQISPPKKLGWRTGTRGIFWPDLSTLGGKHPKGWKGWKGWLKSELRIFFFSHPFQVQPLSSKREGHCYRRTWWVWRQAIFWGEVGWSKLPEEKSSKSKLVVRMSYFGAQSMEDQISFTSSQSHLLNSPTLSAKLEFLFTWKSSVSIRA